MAAFFVLLTGRNARSCLCVRSPAGNRAEVTTILVQFRQLLNASLKQLYLTSEALLAVVVVHELEHIAKFNEKR